MAEPRHHIGFWSKGFTLAEVLITLAIIGVVAALTIPTLIYKYEKKTNAVRAHKAYAEIYQAIRLAEANEGPMNQWNFDSSTNAIERTKYIVETYFSPYIKSLTLCSTGNDGDDNTCGEPVSYLGANYIMENGTGLSFVNKYDTSKEIALLIDVNGANGPRVMGRDIFYFTINDGKLLPYGWVDGLTRKQMLEGYDYDGELIACKKDTAMSMLRHACTSLLMLDNWEFKDDYPY